MTTVDCNLNITNVHLDATYDHLIKETREILYKKLTNDDNYANCYYLQDLNMVMEKDYLVRRYLHKSQGSVDSAVSTMVGALEWVKRYKLHEFKDSHFPREVLALGSTFLYEPDLAGRKTLYIRCKFNCNIKELDEFKYTFVAYKLFRAAEEAGEAGFTLVTDFSETPWSRVQLSWFNFFLEVANHFPYAISVNLSVNLPAICQGAFKIFKYALPADTRSKIQMISRDQLTQYIDIHNIPPFLGGKCQTAYSGPLVVLKGSPYLVDYFRRHGFLSSQVRKIHHFYKGELTLLTKECSWLTSDFVEQMDATLLKVKD